ncbi:glycoside hydrolase family 65 protein [Natronosporangium hydrolyticum]|uniref:Glycoside hydrolase family 65 protein n=1 Tax=Natronosporangium hydrolyticum TaxID=2811111 RepID=A0A895YLD4_9ACTN|nr:glycoside hydrolase family 65 protein [Natronosporangium hydrolyticum]QSB15486.1 glycoside hydrolase family 65 protein [Natronosporangium hydrolyticum]
MIRERAYPVEPWHVRETRLDLDVLAQSESVFALSNGHVGLRGNLDEGEPHGLPGSYLNSFYELRPLPHAEAGYGYPEEGQTVVNVTNGKLIRLLVDDEPFDVRYGELRSHERVLDLRSGTVERKVDWVSPAGRAIRVHSTRLVSFTQRAVAAICYDVEPLDGPARLVIQSGLVANEELPITKADPRVAAALREPLQAEQHISNGGSGLLIHRTKVSGLRIAAAMSHVVDGPPDVVVNTDAFPDWARTTIACVVQPGQRLRVVKFLAYGWSSQRSVPALRDQVGAALAAARFTGWEGLCRDQREYLDTFWDAADVKVEGDPEVQQAVRFGMFHVLQAGARNEMRPIPAKGLTGPGYDGHVFWDTEMFALPVLIYTKPQAAAQVLRWRHATLDLARERARTLGLRGAAFPWRTIRGQECSGYWPAGTAAFHIGADIADATMRYIQVTGDEAFEREVGLELLVETARLWRSLGHHDRHGQFHIDGVTGPDEYTAVFNDNLYTNLMAQRNMLGAAEAAARHPELARSLGVDEEEAASWRDASRAMVVPFDEELGVHQQVEGFTRFQEWDFASTKPEDYPLLLTHPYFDIYRRQVIKQADLVLAMHWRGDAFTNEQKERNFQYYEARTVRDSSLSACTQAVLAAETGHLELAHDYLGEAALIDLHDSHANTSDGVHLAALAGAWIALVAGFGGMRDHDGVLSFAPRLPSRIGRLDFSLLWRGLRLRVSVRPDEVTYFLREGDHEDGSRMELLHHGEPVTVAIGKPVTRPIPEDATVAGPEPQQPPGRAPVRRSYFVSEPE